MSVDRLRIDSFSYPPRRVRRRLNACPQAFESSEGGELTGVGPSLILESTGSPQRREYGRVAGASDLAVKSQDVPPAPSTSWATRPAGSTYPAIRPPGPLVILFVCSFLLVPFYLSACGYAVHLGAWTFDPAPRTASPQSVVGRARCGNGRNARQVRVGGTTGSPQLEHAACGRGGARGRAPRAKPTVALCLHPMSYLIRGSPHFVQLRVGCGRVR